MSCSGQLKIAVKFTLLQLECSSKSGPPAATSPAQPSLLSIYAISFTVLYDRLKIYCQIVKRHSNNINCAYQTLNAYQVRTGVSNRTFHYILYCALQVAIGNALKLANLNVLQSRTKSDIRAAVLHWSPAWSRG